MGFPKGQAHFSLPTTNDRQRGKRHALPAFMDLRDPINADQLFNGLMRLEFCRVGLSARVRHHVGAGPSVCWSIVLEL